MRNRVGAMKRGSVEIACSVFAYLGMCALASLASAKSVNLTLVDSHDDVNGAHFFWTSAHPTGSGVIMGSADGLVPTRADASRR